jgi:hypothetical protein
MKANVLKRVLAAKATVFVGLAMIVAAALTLGTASAALAGTGIGGVFNLGVTNTVNAITKLTGSVAGSSLQIVNNSTNAAATALDLRVATGKPPLKVNSTTKVANLNADQLDDKDSSAFLPANGKAADADKLDGNDSSAFLKSRTYIRGGASEQEPIVKDDMDVYHAQCDAGDLALSGGIANLNGTDTDVTVLNSFPDFGQSGWTVAIRNTGPPEPASAVVVCADQ